MLFKKCFSIPVIFLFVSFASSAFARSIIAVGSDVEVDKQSFKNMDFEGNGAVFDVQGGKLTLTNSTFQGNSVDIIPGGMINTSGQGGAINVANVSTNRGQLFLDNVFVIDNSAIADGSLGGAIKLSGDGTIKNSMFSGNTAGSGGVMYAGKKSSMDILNTNFVNNAADYSGGALGIFKTANLTKVFFQNNKVLDEIDEGGGAIFLGAESLTELTRGEFIGNTSMSNGGAISTRTNEEINNNAAKLDVINNTFINNHAEKNGGAIYSTFYSSQNDVNAVYVENSTFNGNSANNGGAVYNVGLADLSGEVSKITIKDSVFLDNVAKTNGGAIVNSGTGVVSLVGNNTFIGNMAGDNLNDIYSAGGDVNIDGILTLDGGIAGNGNITFTSESLLNATLQTTTIEGASVVTNGAKLNLTVDNGTQNGKYIFVKSGATDKFDVAENVFYNLSMLDSGQIKVEKKSVDSQVVQLKEIGLNTNTAKSIAAMSGVTETGNFGADLVFGTLTTAIQSGDDVDVAEVQEIVDAINPETLAVVQSMTTETQSTIDNLTSGRMVMVGMGRNGGDTGFTNGGIWIQGLYNRSKNGDKFNGDSRGIVAGIDGTINKTFMVGAGYSYAGTNISAKTRDTDIKSHTVFLYGQYKPNQWYANATLNYTMSKYEESGNVMGVTLNSDYNAKGFGANVSTGYDFMSGITPEIGLRYLHISSDEYTNTLGIKNKYDDTNLLTGIAGFRYGFNIKNPHSSFVLRPELSAAAKYDALSNALMATVALPGVDSYSIEAERLSRFGGEFGFGLKLVYQDVELSANYMIDVRDHYTSQTGLAKFRYNF